MQQCVSVIHVVEVFASRFCLFGVSRECGVLLCACACCFPLFNEFDL